MSSSRLDSAEVDRLARLFRTALVNLHADVTASTTPARLVSIITEEPPSRSLPPALVQATIGLGQTFAELIHILIQSLKATLRYDRVKQLHIEDAEHGQQSFISLWEQDFQAALRSGYRRGALAFDLKNEDGSLNILNPCFSSGFISASAVIQGFTSAGQYHRVVALNALGIGGWADASDVEESRDAKEAYAIAALICFAMVGAHKYAEMLAQDGMTYEKVSESIKALKEGDVVAQAQAVALLDTVIADLDNRVCRGRSVEVVSPLIFGDAGILGI